MRKPTRRQAVTVLIVSMVVATLPGFAASLGGLTSETLGADNAVVSACDSNGFNVSYATTSTTVTAVTVSGIADPGCEGGQLSLTLANGTTSIAAVGPQTVPTDAGTADNSMTLTVSPPASASAVTAVHVVITGP